MNGESSLREVALGSGEVRRKKMLDAQHFAEGVTRLNGRCRRAPPPRNPPHRLIATSACSCRDRWRAPQRTSAKECRFRRFFGPACAPRNGLNVQLQ